jgi:hypothetical protein
LRLITRHFKRPRRAVIALLLAGLVLFLNALSASPSLHEWFHPDAGAAGHECAVTLFAHGHADSAAVDSVVPEPVTLVAVVPSFQISDFRPAIENLPAGRAPPAASAHS